MAINKNHEFEELNGIKCGIVEKNVSAERAEFLKQILEYNNYEVIVAPFASKKPATESESVAETYTIGVTDYTFNPINAIFGRMLKTSDGQIVTLAYWNQKAEVNNDDVPYFETKL